MAREFRGHGQVGGNSRNRSRSCLDRKEVGAEVRAREKFIGGARIVQSTETLDEPALPGPAQAQPTG